MKYVLAVLLLVTSLVAASALTSGTVSGTVKGIPCLRLSADQCQKPMPNVQLEFASRPMGATASTTTSADGTFQIHLHPGQYSIRVLAVTGTKIIEGPTELTVLPFVSYTVNLLVPSGMI